MSMPELPEVETVVRGLRESLVGQKIVAVNVLWAGCVAELSAEAFVERVTGRAVTGVDRRGKWIVLHLDDGFSLFVHLRMTGQLLIEAGGCRPGDKYTRVLFYLGGGEQLRFSDMRKFGRLNLTDAPAEVLGELGPEPLDQDFTVDRLRAMLAETRRRIKPLLLDQRFLAGLGNIYVNEALWRAQVHPLRPANSLSMGEVAALHNAIQAVLREAIEEGGTTLDNGNFRQADGEAGDFASRLLVYGRQGDPCACCGAAIERITVGQRGTFVCPVCQLPPRDA